MTGDTPDKVNYGKFISRACNLPIVSSAVGQINTFYNNTKEHNIIFKITLQTAEYGMKIASCTATPIVSKLKTPIRKIDDLAAESLEVLEDKVPILTKPTEQWSNGGSYLYEITLKPSVNTVTAAKDYGMKTISSVQNTTAQSVVGVKDYTVNKFGQILASPLDRLLDLTDQYVEHFLPEKHECTASNIEDVGKQNGGVISRVSHVGFKVRTRLYARASRDLRLLQLRFKIMLKKLSDIFDLINRIRKNVSSRMAASSERLYGAWRELSMSEDEAVRHQLNTPHLNKTLERRLISTTRHLFLNLKSTISYLSGNAGKFVPRRVKLQLGEALVHIENVYTSLLHKKVLGKTPNEILEMSKDRLSQLQTIFTTVYHTIVSAPALLKINNKVSKETEIDEDEKEIDETESETPKDSRATVESLAEIKEIRIEEEEIKTPSDNGKSLQEEFNVKEINKSQVNEDKHLAEEHEEQIDKKDNNVDQNEKEANEDTREPNQDLNDSTH